MFTTMLEVDNLLRRLTEGINYLNNYFDSFKNASKPYEVYLDKARDTAECFERLSNNLLVQAFEDEVRNNYLSSNNSDKLISFLTIIDARVYELYVSMLKYLDNETFVIKYIDWLIDEDIEVFDTIRSTAKYATIKNYSDKPYFLICDVTQRYIVAANRHGADRQHSPSLDKTISQQLGPIEPVIKLKWNGAADTLYDVFRQLKNYHLPKGEPLIDDSYDQIARFIQQTFVGFDEVATSTIRGKLTKNERPKKTHNRVDLDLTQPD